MYKSEQFMCFNRVNKLIGLLLVLLLVFNNTSSAFQPSEQVKFDFKQDEKEIKDMSLKEGLDILIQETHTGIVYEPQVVEGIQISFFLSDIYNYAIDQLLNLWLENTSLTFNRIDNGENYVILKKSDEISSNLKLLSSPVEGESSNVNNRVEVFEDNTNMEDKSSQETTVRGKVTSINGESLSSVSVTIKGSNLGTVTDGSGMYRLNYSIENPVLIFSSIGFNSHEEAVNNREVVNVSLSPIEQVVEEVVVDALGFTRKADGLGYSSSQVDGGQISNAMEGSVINSLAGKASGVRIGRTSSDPGAGSHIQIRGASTIGGVQPLIVLDGIPVDNSSSGNSTEGVYQQSRLNDINPDDIESMDILKGAAAAALWGSRASNGVVVITTKKGKANDKLNISFKSSFSYDQILERHPLQNRFGQGNFGVYNQTSQHAWGDLIEDRFGGSDVVDNTGDFFRASNGNIYYPITEKRNQTIFNDSNFDQVFQNGYFTDNSLSLSGGDTKGTYFVSFSDFKQEGIIRNNSDYRRTTFRINASRNFGEHITLSTNNAYTLSNSNRIRKGNSSSGLYLGMLRTPPDFNILDHEGEYYAGPGATPERNRQRTYRNPLGINANPGFNTPLWTIYNQENLSRVNRFISNLQFNARATHWLEFMLRSGIDTYTDERSAYFATGSVGQLQSLGRYDESKAVDYEFNTDAVAIISPEIAKDLETEVLIGFNFNQRSKQSISGTITGFIDPDSPLRNFVNGRAGSYGLSNSRTLRRNAAMYSSIDLNYRNYLHLLLTGRFESASTFGELSKSSFFFPSATVAWQFHKIMDLPEAISFGKLRSSVALVGVEPVMYRTISQYSNVTYSDSNGGSLDGSRFGNGAFVPANRVGNPYLRPEIKTELEIGLDLRFFNHRLRTSLTYYNNRTKDVLFDVPIPSSTGFTNMQDNAGEIKNQGLEVDVNYDVIKNNDLTWTLGLLWDKNRNVVSKLPDAESLNLDGLSGISGRAVQGYQLGVLWGRKWLRDDENSFILDENGFPQMDEAQGVIGDPNPQWRGSFLTTLKYKGFALDAVVETMQGGNIFAGTYASLLQYGMAPITANLTVAPHDMMNAAGQVITEGTEFRGNIGDFGAGSVALDENWYRLGSGGYSGASEQFIQDASWIRLQQLTLSYSLTSEKFKNISKLQGVELALTGRNLFVWAKEFKGNDPNTNLTGISTVRGIDYFNNPGTRSYVFTLRLTY